MITGAEHLARIIAATTAPDPVDVAVADALGLVLAADVVAGLDLPGFDNSAMDGYAVRSADLAGATVDRPTGLRVLGDIAAGAVATHTVEPGTTLRIMTGAPMPAGADAVVEVEETDGGTQAVAVRLAPDPGRHVRRRGGDVRVGDVLLTAGTGPLGPGHLALAAAAGAASLRVVPPVTVAVISTGDELVAVGEPPGPGQIVDSNSLMLEALALAAGARVTDRLHARDDADALAAALTTAAAGADVVLTTGGVSMGAYDTVKELLTARGGVRFDKVAMRPGMPQGFGILPGGVPVVTLPGNPVSALVSFHVFVLPLLRHLAGRPVDPAAWPDSLGTGRPVRAAESWRSAPAKVELARGAVAHDGFRLTGGQGSHQLGALAAATHLAVIPADRDHVDVGDELVCLPLVGGASW